jgi:hypothetical protein
LAAFFGRILFLKLIHESDESCYSFNGHGVVHRDTDASVDGKAFELLETYEIGF